jgi:hypothetical protein
LFLVSYSGCWSMGKVGLKWGRLSVSNFGYAMMGIMSSVNFKSLAYSFATS